MKAFSILLLASLFFFGCSSKPQTTQNIDPQLVVGKNLAGLTLNDQFEKPHKIETTTQTIIVAFSKDNGHLCNEYFAEQNPTYLADNHAVFIADISHVPSLIRSMFVQPGLKDLTHRVLLIEDDSTSANFRTQANAESIVIAKLKDGVITTISLITTKEALAKSI